MIHAKTDAIQCLIQRWGARPLAQRHWLLPKRSKLRAKIGFSSRVAKEGKSHQIVVWTGAGLSWKFMEIVVYNGNTGNQGWDMELWLSGFVMLFLSASPLVSLGITTVTTKILTLIFTLFLLKYWSRASSLSSLKSSISLPPFAAIVAVAAIIIIIIISSSKSIISKSSSSIGRTSITTITKPDRSLSHPTSVLLRHELSSAVYVTATFALKPRW